MSSARVLLEQFLKGLENIDHGVDQCVDLFAEDGILEFPYFPAIGLKRRFDGPTAIRALLETVKVQVTSFEISALVIHDMKDESSLFAEYHSKGRIKASDRIYVQNYASFLVVRDGKIKLLRAYLNVIATAKVLLPNGIADVPGFHFLDADCPSRPVYAAITD